MDTHPKFGSDFETADTTATPRGCEKIITYVIEVSWESRTGLSRRLENSLRGQGKEASRSFVVRGWIWAEHFLAWAEA